MLRLLKWLLGLLLVIVLLLGGAVGYFTATEDGLQRLLALGQRHAPGELRWSRADGRIAGPLDLAGFSYRQADGLEVAIDSAELRWEPRELLRRRLHLNKLALSGLTLRLPELAEAAPPAEGPLRLPDLELPLSVRIDELDLRDIRIYPSGVDEPIVIERVQFAAAAEGSRFQLLRLDATAPEGSASVAGVIEPRGDYPLDLKLTWRYRHPQFGAFSGGGTAKGTLRRLVVNQRVDGAATAELRATLTDLMSQPGWDARLQLASDDLGVFSPALAKAPLEATLQSRGNLDDFSAEAQLATTAPEAGPVELALEATGNTRTVHLSKLSLRPQKRPGELLLSGDVGLTPLRLDLAGRWRELGWPLDADARQLSLPEGELALRGTPDDLVATLSTGLDGPQLGRLRLALDATVKGRAVTLSSLRLAAPDGVLDLTAKGGFDPASGRLDLNGQWRELGWPLVGEPEFRSAKGRFGIDGTLDKYRLTLEAEAGGKAIPAGSWRLDGEGSQHALERFELVGKLLDGELRAGGSAAWQPAPAWQVRVDASGIDPSLQWPELPGKLNLALASKGEVGADGPALTATLERLSGRFRGQPVAGRGELALTGKALTVDRLNIEHGRTKLAVNGKLGDRWALEWTLDAPKLASLAPMLKGRVSASGRLAGDAARPVVSADLELRNLAVGGTKLKRLDGKALIDIGGRKRSRLDFNATGLVLAGQQWRELKISGGGKPDSHRLEVKLSGDLARLDLALDGGIDGRQWRGRLLRLDAAGTPLGDWRLQRPAALRASAEQASLETACLASDPARICAEGGWSAAKGVRGKVKIASFDAARLREFLPPDMRLEAALDGDLDGSVDASGRVRASAALRLGPGTLSAPGDVEPVEIRFGPGKVDATLDGDRAGADFGLDLGALGRVSGKLGLRRLDSDPLLGGDVQARIADLALVSAFVPQLQAVEGRLDADLKLGGPLSMPVVNGRVLIDGFAAEVPELSLKIEDGRFELASDGKGPLRISGSARSGEGALKLDGTLDPATRALELKISGDRFQVAATRQIRAVISPDMRVTMEADGMRVEGKLLIPSAHIKAGGGGGDGKLVQVSSDVVIVDGNGEAKKKAPAGNFHLHLRIVLGDDIQVEAADFSGKLRGGLLITQKPGLAPRATGEIEVVNGDYIVYGQQLSIQRGRILFSGGPVDNPRLDLDVARRVEAYDVLAGAKIRGTAQAPILQLYSEPPMPDSSILSYMLLGQPPGTKGGSYTLGKYLTPDLYVGYGIGLFNAINTFNMRYRLTDRLALQAASGAASSADLIYTIERW